MKKFIISAIGLIIFCNWHICNARYQKYAEIDGINYYLTKAEEVDSGFAQVSLLPGERIYSGYITIPEKVKYEGYTFTVNKVTSRAFARSNITAIDFGNVDYIENFVCNDCKHLKSVTFGPILQGVENYTFYGCDNVERIISLNENVPYFFSFIGHFNDYVFENCKVYVPDNRVVRYKSTWFWENFKYILPLSELLPDISEDGMNFRSNSDGYSLQKVMDSDQEELSIPDYIDVEGNAYPVNDLDHFVFKGLENLKNLYLPEHIDHLCDNSLAFADNLQNIYTKFKDFGKKQGTPTCNGFLAVAPRYRAQAENPESPLPEDFFERVTVHVPAGEIEKYRDSDFWGRFINIIDDYEVAETNSIGETFIHDSSIVHELYDMTGTRISDPVPGNIYIEICNGKPYKKIQR